MTKSNGNMFNAPLSRRQALKLMGGMASMAALSACVAPAGQTPATTTEGAAAPAQAPTQMRVAHRREYFAEMETLFTEAVQNWAGENNVDVEVTPVASEAFQDFVAKTIAEVEAGTAPDLIYHVRLVQQLYFFGALQPVSDVVAQAEEMYGTPAPGHIQQNLIDGEWYGIPYINGGSGEFALRSRFEEAGIDPVNDMATFDQRREACLEISDAANGFYGWGRTANQGGDGHGFVQAVIHNWGGSITNAEMTEITFNSPEMVAAVAWLTETFTAERYQPMLPPGIISWTDVSNNEAYLAGSIGYTSNAASVYAQAKAEENPVFEDTVVLPAAVGPTNTVLTGGGGGQMHIPENIENGQLARDLALYLLDPEIFLPISLISAGLFLPAYSGYYEMAPVVEALAEDANLARMGQQALGDYPGLSWPAAPSPFFDVINAESILTDMVAQTIAQGVSPEDAVAQATSRIEQIADELQVFA